MPGFPSPVVIEWPPQQKACVLPGWGLTVYDAATGEPVTVVTRADVTFHVDAESIITADLTVLTGPDGQPAREEPADPVTGKVPPLVLDIGEDGTPVTAVFRAVVAGMRIREGGK